MAEKTRPSLNFTLVCDDVRQEVGGKISLMGLFENIHASHFRAIHPKLVVLNEWAEGRGEFDALLRIISPDKKTIIRQAQTRLRLADVRYKQRDISVHMNIEFREPGTYWIENYVDGVMVASMPLPVVLVKEKSFH